MINIQTKTCDDAWRQAAKLVRDNGLAQESRTFRSDVTTETLELLHASMTIEDPRQRIVFSRPINPAFAIAECIWILAGSNDLSFIRFWNETMKNFSDDGQTLHGAYGYRLSSGQQTDFGLDITISNNYFVPGQFPFSQLYEAYMALKSVPHSRQVVLQVWDGRTDFPINGKPRYKDIPCNVMAHLLVRDGRLNWLQIMRSNDLMWGTPYNFIQWTTLQEVVAGWLGLEVGQYTHVASSLHVYETHWDELKSLNLNGPEHAQFDVWAATDERYWVKNPNPENQSDLRIEGYDNWVRVFKIVIKATKSLMYINHPSTAYRIIEEAGQEIPQAYYEWLWLLGAEVCRKLGRIDDAKYMIALSGSYYQASWLRWLERKQAEKV